MPASDAMPPSSFSLYTRLIKYEIFLSAILIFPFPPPLRFRRVRAAGRPGGGIKKILPCRDYSGHPAVLPRNLGASLGRLARARGPFSAGELFHRKWCFNLQSLLTRWHKIAAAKKWGCATSPYNLKDARFSIDSEWLLPRALSKQPLNLAVLSASGNTTPPQKAATIIDSE